MCVSGWLRLVASTKLQVSFAKEPYKRDDSHPICAYRASLRGDARYRALLQGSFIGLFCKRDLSDARYAHMEAMHDTHIWGGYRLFYRALLQKRPERCTIRTYGGDARYAHVLWWYVPEVHLFLIAELESECLNADVTVHAGVVCGCGEWVWVHV